jgi:hypothetical protein
VTIGTFFIGAKAMLSRRNILATAAAGAMVSATTARAATFGNPDQPAEGAVNVTNPKALTQGRRIRASPETSPPFLTRRQLTSTAVLGVVQSGTETHPERRVGAADHPGRF